jgi:PKD domain-containing protein
MQPRSTIGGWWRWVRLTVMEPWQLFGSIALIAAVFALGMLINHARQMETPTGRSGQLVSLIGPSFQPFVDTAPPSVTPSGEPSSPPAQTVGPTGGAPHPAASVSSRPSAKATVKPAPRPTTSHSPPAAILHVSPVSGSAPLSVVADASASSGVSGARIVSYVFDFGDGTRTGPQSSAVANHWYDTAGEYVVTVVVTDSNGLASADVITIIIT